MKRFFLLLFFLLSIYTNAQHTISGSVRNESINKPLAFATVRLSDGKTIIADVDGKFTIENTTGLDHFSVSYSGFETVSVPLEAGKKFYTVKLREKTTEISELIIGGNPALAVIKKTIEKKYYNDPKKRLGSFQFKTYNKLIVTANPDSINGKIDSVFLYEKIGSRLLKLDSSDYKFKKIVQRQHLYQTEKVSEFKFNQKTGLKESIIAARMAGFKQPIYEYISLKLQSFSD